MLRQYNPMEYESLDTKAEIFMPNPLVPSDVYARIDGIVKRIHPSSLFDMVDTSRPPAEGNYPLAIRYGVAHFLGSGLEITASEKNYMLIIEEISANGHRYINTGKKRPKPTAMELLLLHSLRKPPVLYRDKSQD